MGAMDNWDVTLLVVAGYLAVLALVRLMARYRDQILADLRRQWTAEKKRQRQKEEEEQSKQSA